VRNTSASGVHYWSNFQCHIDKVHIHPLKYPTISHVPGELFNFVNCGKGIEEITDDPVPKSMLNGLVVTSTGKPDTG
jgi:hypothetical protein